ncbi:MAG: hypothetical protein J5726_08785 [Treponema sp.]|nr:hypothetical protein [Treponema sp.]
MNKMKPVYEEVPVFENDNYLLRFVTTEDANDLVKVYSDKNALPFFNSDNCHGDNFYYSTIERMNEAIQFWHEFLHGNPEDRVKGIFDKLLDDFQMIESL